MLAAALDGKSDMVGHGKGKVCRELTRDVGTGDIRDLSGELHHLRVDLVEQRQVARVDTVEGSVNLVERDLVRATGKPDTAAERNELAPFALTQITVLLLIRLRIFMTLLPGASTSAASSIIPREFISGQPSFRQPDDSPRLPVFI